MCSLDQVKPPPVESPSPPSDARAFSGGTGLAAAYTLLSPILPSASTMILVCICCRRDADGGCVTPLLVFSPGWACGTSAWTCGSCLSSVPYSLTWFRWPRASLQLVPISYQHHPVRPSLLSGTKAQESAISPKTSGFVRKKHLESRLRAVRGTGVRDTASAAARTQARTCTPSRLSRAPRPLQ